MLKEGSGTCIVTMLHCCDGVGRRVQSLVFKENDDDSKIRPCSFPFFVVHLFLFVCLIWNINIYIYIYGCWICTDVGHSFLNKDGIV